MTIFYNLSSSLKHTPLAVDGPTTEEAPPVMRPPQFTEGSPIGYEPRCYESTALVTHSQIMSVQFKEENTNLHDRISSASASSGRCNLPYRTSRPK